MPKGEYSGQPDECWIALKQGDSAAFEHIYRTHVHSLYRYGLSIWADEDAVLDAIHDVFTEVWHKRDRISYTDNVKFYLLKALKNRLIRLIDTAGRMQEISLSTLLIDPASLSTEQDEEALRQQTKVSDCLRELPPRQQEIVRLRFYENLSHQQIADLLNIQPQSAKNLLFRAIDTLRKAFCQTAASLLMLFFGSY
ncbi:RNA polymerase sigma factor [Spirosoma montaniterrae]|uniref:RNA polymerase sigma factor 70 region 4 type 2 domain-containing protein n=1 Tax=Spirosoma montaniterrae TaxID=1178516 RepID=A0A1P9WS78_9BACT|nr:sigma-70 family RNA polymerase sigma factor [Spirosoma montaniterrae]AQG78203.1 hypothetical protein AWR27_01880 [Spirosoma montaniterrae]